MFNRAVDSIFTNTVLAIEPGWGESCLKQYLHELDLIEAGVPFSELGIKERKAEQASYFLNPDGRQVYDTQEVRQGAIAFMKLQGVMRANEGLSTRGIDSLVNELRQAYGDSRIEGAIIEANTGGGEVAAAQILRAAISSRTKPVVVHANLLASGGILSTLDADEIIAYDDLSQFGSVGIFISISKQFVSWYNENVDDIYSNKSPNKNKAFRDLLSGNRETIVDDLTRKDEMFMKAVQEARPLKGDIEETLSGSMFMAKDAKRRGLIDGIGDTAYAIERLKSHIASYKRKKR